MIAIPKPPSPFSPPTHPTHPHPTHPHPHPHPHPTHPNPHPSSELTQIPQPLRHKLNPRRRVSRKHEVVVRGVGAQEVQDFKADGVDDGAGEVGGGVG